MILLDTHILLAVIGQVDLVLPEPVARQVRSGERFAVSVATIWEIAIKNRIGKLKLEFGLDRLPDKLRDFDIEILDVTAAHTLAPIGPEPITKDPFDRLLLGVCAAEAMKLLTIDRALAHHPLAWRET